MQYISKSKIWAAKKMNIEYILRLIEWLDNLVYEKKGRLLKNEEKDLLKQVLTGKKLDTIKINGLTDKYTRNGFARQLWNLLSEVSGERIGKINATEVLNRLYLEQASSKTIPCSGIGVKARIKNPGYAVSSGSKIAQGVKSYCINPSDTNDKTSNQIDTYSICSSSLNSRWLRQQFKASGSGSKNASENTWASTVAEFQSSDRTCQTDDSEQNKNSSCSWQSYMKFMKSGLPLLIALGVCGVLYGVSWLANWYGVENHVAGRLPQAQLGYTIALRVNPWSIETHYNLGTVYEDQQNYPQAHTQYQKAIEGGLVAAYNNQARLYILEGKYERAVSLLEIGMPLVKNDTANTRYSFLKNRGWVHLLQGRLGQASVDLNQAIALKSDDAAAHCLLAQVLEQQVKNTQVQREWENCLRFAQPQIPEENKWMRLAQQRLKGTGGAK